MALARPVWLSFAAPSREEKRRARWRLLRDLLGGAVVLAVWLSLWSWVAIGLAGPLTRDASAAGGPVSTERA